MDALVTKLEMLKIADNIADAEKSSKYTEQIKRLGNISFIKGDMTEAISKYTAVLQRDEDPEVLSNRGAAYSKVHMHANAKIDLLRSIKLETVPTSKAVFRLVKAMWGLREYGETVGFLHDLKLRVEALMTMTSITEAERKNNQGLVSTLSELLVKANILEFQNATGDYEMTELLVKQHHVYDCAEFAGPIEIKKATRRGRGIFVTENVKAGQTLIGTKAFAIIYPSANPDQEKGKKTIRNGVLSNEDPKHGKLVATVTDILTANPACIREFYKLYAGPTFKYDDDDDPAKDDQSEDFRVDLERIDQICFYNGIFSCSNTDPRFIPSLDDVDDIKHANTYGLWLSASFLNHSCVDNNCSIQIYGDFMIVRAVKDISEGEEVISSYNLPMNMYKDRKERYNRYGFVCACRLCQVEESEPEARHVKRKRLMKKFQNILGGLCNPLKPLETVQSEMVALRPDHPECNMTLFFINSELAIHQLQAEQYEKAGDSLVSAFMLSQHTCLAREGLKFGFKASVSYFIAGAMEKSKEWWIRSCNEMKIIYGTSEVLLLVLNSLHIDFETVAQVLVEFENPVSEYV